jgi:two-component system chemotaxis response regulator CheB
MTDCRDVVVVAASAGGLQPLRAMLAMLPADLPAAVLVVLHMPASGGRTLPRILDRAGPLSAARAVDGEPLRHGHVHVAPPDRHMLVVDNTVRLSRGPRQNGVRPAADPLFRSAALHAGPRTTAVVLSGMLDDAALGSATVERRGGRVLVQDPGEADYNSMPRSAIASTKHPVVLPAADLGKRVRRLAAGTGGPQSGDEQQRPAAAGADTVLDAELAAEITGLLAGNPDTSTAYSSLSAGSQPFDCLAGDRWSPHPLLEERSAVVERALWLAVRVLEERGSLAGRLAAAARARSHALTAEQFGGVEVEARQAAQAIREVASVMITDAAAQVAVRSTRA